MTLEQEDHGAYRVLKAGGFLDGRTSESQDLQEAFDRPGMMDKHVVVDCSAVQYMNSSVLGAFVRFLADLQENNHQLVLMKASNGLKSVLVLTGLAQLLPVVDSREAAEAALGIEPSRQVDLKGINYSQLESEIEARMQGVERPREQSDEAVRKLLDG